MPSGSLYSPQYKPDSPGEGRNPNRQPQPQQHSPWPGGQDDDNQFEIDFDIHSLWGAPSSNDFDDLNLPPINADNNYDQLPSFNDNHYFDALPPLPSPSHLILPDNPASYSQEGEPPPSNQQARRHYSVPSQYQVAGSESPDPFENYLELSPPPADMPVNASTRRSSVVDLTESSPIQHKREMAPSRKRKRETAVEARASKAARPSSSRSASAKHEDLDKVELVDLSAVEGDKQYEDFAAKEKALKAQAQADLIKAQNQAEADRPVKLAEFQCIICMDNPTDLTVTHCGHLFCAECLHSALYAGDKKCCPVCRTLINLKPGTGNKQPKNGIFHLEMKLMTANKKGKQPVRGR